MMTISVNDLDAHHGERYKLQKLAMLWVYYYCVLLNRGRVLFIANKTNSIYRSLRRRGTRRGRGTVRSLPVGYADQLSSV